MTVDTLVTTQSSDGRLRHICSKFLLQKRTTLGRLGDVDCTVLQPVTSSMMSELNKGVVDHVEQEV